MSVPEFYGRYADLYDAVATFPGVGRWRAAAAEALDLSPGDTVIEMGCGTGANHPYLRRRVGAAGRVVGVDLTRPLLHRARGRGADALLQADAARPPVREADAVLATFVCGMFDEPGSVVADWCDLVGAGGRVALLDAARSSHPVGRLLNPAFAAFTAASAPSESLVPPYEATGELDRRVREARTTLTDRARDRRYRAFGLGFVGLLAGTVD